MVLEAFSLGKSTREHLSLITEIVGEDPLNSNVTAEQYAKGKPAITDFAIGATFDISYQQELNKLWKKFNWLSRKAYQSASRMIRARYNPTLYQFFREKRDEFNNELYHAVTEYEDQLLRAKTDRTNYLKPNAVAIGKDLITNQGINTIVENFMLFGATRIDTMEAGTGESVAYGGDKGLETLVASVSIPLYGFQAPYGIEARHGAPFLASMVSTDVAEIGLKDSISGRYYSRSVFPVGDIITHTKDFDVYSVLHISLCKAV
jgi:hypothetical protein